MMQACSFGCPDERSTDASWIACHSGAVTRAASALSEALMLPRSCGVHKESTSVQKKEDHPTTSMDRRQRRSAVPRVIPDDKIASEASPSHHYSLVKHILSGGSASDEGVIRIFVEPVWTFPGGESMHSTSLTVGHGVGPGACQSRRRAQSTELSSKRVGTPHQCSNGTHKGRRSQGRKQRGLARNQQEERGVWRLGTNLKQRYRISTEISGKTCARQNAACCTSRKSVTWSTFVSV